ncbi:MAG: hypothetical protein QM668_19045 [Agriterribacter sp.]
MAQKKEIQASEIWNEDKMSSLKSFIRSHSQKQSKERKLKNELLAIQYQIEDYIDSEHIAEKKKILDFVKMYLKVFNATQKSLAALFEMQNGNLHKYLNEGRKLNPSMVLKLSAFSHTDPEYWLRIEVKNELFEVTKEKEKISEYKKYDYKHLLASAE